MTRINCGIPEERVTSVHVLAELRELPRIPNNIRNGKYSLKDQPTEFKLGTGHVKFFYDKLTYLEKRYNNLYREAIKRGLNVKYYQDLFVGLPQILFNDYVETEHDTIILKQRIKERILKNPSKYKDIERVNWYLNS